MVLVSFIILLICCFFSRNLDIIEPKKAKLGKEKVWDVSSYRNEEMETLRNLGVQIEYLILPDNRIDLLLALLDWNL